MDIPGIALNEDDSHFYFTRAGQALSEQLVDAWVDQYANTQVRELFLCPNAMRTSYASQVWDPIWRDYDPSGPDDQPLLASMPPAERKNMRGWIHTAWELDQMGIDVYARWIARCRQVGISPWMSMRMNDVHYVNDERAFLHSEFWRANPQYRRVPYHFTDWVDRAFDYGQQAVRDYHMALIREIVERYDMDGLELDWMRFGYHLRPGYEGEGAALLTEFTAQVRALLDQAEARRGHRIKLGARVPSRPQSALGLGMDAITWAKRKLIDMLVATPFWATTDTDTPIEIWRRLLEGTDVLLAAGLEILVRPYPGGPAKLSTLEMVRGAVSSALARGAQRIYLFNHMDSQTTVDDPEHYPALLREVGSLATLGTKSRRHVLTYADTWPTGEAQAVRLPATCEPDGWQAFRLHIGPAPASGQVTAVLAVACEAAANGEALRLLLNGVPCASGTPTTLDIAIPGASVYAFEVPAGAAHSGYNVLEFTSSQRATVHWVELSIAP